MKIVYEDPEKEKPSGCFECPFAKWSYLYCRCLILQKEEVDNGKNYLFKCPIRKK